METGQRRCGRWRTRHSRFETVAEKKSIGHEAKATEARAVSTARQLGNQSKSETGETVYGSNLRRNRGGLRRCRRNSLRGRSKTAT